MYMSRFNEEYGTHSGVLMKLAIRAMKAEEDELHSEIHQAMDYFRRLHNAVEDIEIAEKRQIKKNPKQYLGYFDIASGEVKVSDPCYDSDIWCNHTLKNVKNGKWMAVKVSSDEDMWGIRVAQLYAYVGDEPSEDQFNLVEDAQIGVDSGQAGIFDLPTYRNNDIIDHSDFLSPARQAEEGEKWYSACCDITLAKQSAGVLTGGAVSSTGYGDGGYNLYAVVDDKGQITAIKIVYIGDGEEEEEE